mmetsp:Transcript_37120/g.97261  ORF Transcript_37120/g.97261 Transcript_37120/m.97261 type:complete len:258 (+) Transcript_37120:518-1291(+)
MAQDPIPRKLVRQLALLGQVCPRQDRRVRWLLVVWRTVPRGLLGGSVEIVEVARRVVLHFSPGAGLRRRSCSDGSERRQSWAVVGIAALSVVFVIRRSSVTQSFTTHVPRPSFASTLGTAGPQVPKSLDARQKRVGILTAVLVQNQLPAFGGLGHIAPRLDNPDVPTGSSVAGPLRRDGLERRSVRSSIWTDQLCHVMCRRFFRNRTCQSLSSSRCGGSCSSFTSCAFEWVEGVSADCGLIYSHDFSFHQHFLLLLR